MVLSSVAIAALLSTGLISVAPNLLLLLFSFDTVSLSSSTSRLFLNLGQSLAAGALLGDVFLHILPHASASSDEAGAWILVGFSLFLGVDLLIRLIHNNSEHGEHESCNGTEDSKTTKALSSGDTATEKKRINMSAVALNLIADALHNFTDGLAIGASFAALARSSSVEHVTVASLLASGRGGLATFSILLHEIPHELGDFCTLVQSGFTRQQAVLAQFGTSVAAFLGTVCALVLSDTLLTGDQLGFLTAGGFVYLAAVTILPEVLSGDEHDDKHRSHGSSSTKNLALYSFAQLVAFLCGIAFMGGVALLEGHDHGSHENRELHQHHGHDHHHHQMEHHHHHQMEHHHHGHAHHDHGHHHGHEHGEL